MNRDRLRAVFIDILDLPPDSDPATWEYGKTEGWDSLAHMQLVAAIEETFDLMLEAEEVLAMSRFDEAVKTLRSHGVDVD